MWVLTHFSFIVWSQLEHVHKNSHSFINSWYFTAFSHTNKTLACRRFGEEDLLFLPLQLIMLIMAGIRENPVILKNPWVMGIEIFPIFTPPCQEGIDKYPI